MKILLSVKFQIFLRQFARGPRLIERVLQQIVFCNFQACFLPEFGNFHVDSPLGITNSNVTPIRVQRRKSFRFDAQEDFWRAVRNIATRPESSTALSRRTEYWCKRSNATRSGLSASVASTEPICARSTSIRAITPY